MYAHRPEARRLLEEALERETPMGRIRVIGAEGLIAFKLQGYVNDPARHRDWDDLRALLKANRAQLDMLRVRRYFALFAREPMLDELLAELDHQP